MTEFPAAIHNGHTCVFVDASLDAVKAELRAEEATNAELRRQLTGTGTLLGKAEAAVRAVRDLIDPASGMATRPFATDERYFAEDDIRAALGAVGTPDD